MSENKFWKQAKEELAYLSGDPDFQRLVESRAGMLKDIHCFKKQAAIEGHATGHAEGLADGRIEGERKKQKEIAKKMKNKNMPIDEIVELTGLTKE